MDQINPTSPRLRDSAINRLSNLRDAHLHFAEHGESLSLINLADCTSVRECLERVARAAANMPRDAWVRAKGARVAAWREQRYPTARELDDAGGGRAVVVQSFDHHAMSVSSEVLRAAGITSRALGPGHRASAEPETPNPETRAFVERDTRGIPTGVLLESACKAVWDAMPTVTLEDKRAHVLAADADLRAQGFVEAHDMFATAQLANALLNLEREGRLTLRVWLYATPEHLESVEQVFAQRCGGQRVSSGAHVRLAGLKLFADGTLNSRTAAMLTPYTSPERERGVTSEPAKDVPPPFPLPEGGGLFGTLFFTTQQIAQHIRDASAKGYQTAVHAIGDAAVRQVLDAYERAGRPALAGDVTTPALRIEHVQFLDEADVARFAAMNVIASMQPSHLLTDVEAIQRYMPLRAERAFAMRDLIDAARRAGRDPAELVWLGSDAPVVPPTPSDTVRAAVTRGRDDGIVIAAAQAISAEDIHLCYQTR